jgi:hypothetical protein
MSYPFYLSLCDQCGRETPEDELVPVSTPELKMMCEDCDLTWGVGFNHWFAGLLDGEGCFFITRQNRRGSSWRCAACIALRDDDRPVLEEIVRRTGLGSVVNQGGRQLPRRPLARWETIRKQDAIALASLLDRTRLRSKKARDYVVWREAVEVWATVSYSSPSSAAQWVRMEELATELKSVRRYESR